MASGLNEAETMKSHEEVHTQSAKYISNVKRQTYIGSKSECGESFLINRTHLTVIL